VDTIEESAVAVKHHTDQKLKKEEIDIDREAALLRGLSLEQTLAKESEMKVMYAYQLRSTSLQMLGADPTIYERLTASLAPSVWEMEDVKKGLLCQLFGGSDMVIHPSMQSDPPIFECTGIFR